MHELAKFMDGPFAAAPAIVGLGAFLGGLGFLAIGVFYYRSIYRSRSWSETSARILIAEIKEQVYKSQRSYSLDVRYEFNVAGQLCKGDRYSFSMTSERRRESVQQLVDQFQDYIRQSHVVPVYYDNEDPTKSVLNRELNSSFPIYMGIVAFMFFAVSYHLLISSFDFSSLENLFIQLEDKFS